MLILREMCLFLVATVTFIEETMDCVLRDMAASGFSFCAQAMMAPETGVKLLIPAIH